MSDFDSLPQPGTQPFFPALLSCIRCAAPSLPLDPVVLQALLLCLLAGNKNLILRTREEDIGYVSKLATSTLTSIFGYSTHKLKIHQDSKYQTSSEFLRSLFLRSSTPTPNSPNASDEFTNPSISSHRSKAMHKRRLGSRTSSVAMRPKLQRQPIQRSFSYPTEGPVVPSIITITTSLPDAGLFADEGQIPHTSNTGSVRPNFQRPPLRPPGIQTDSAPLLTRRSSSDATTLPRALVISGLENAQGLPQRALLKVLSDKRVALDDSDGNLIYNLPHGFIVVYVCAADPRERPAIHKTLLDKFAMSTTINLHPSTQHAVRHTLAHQRFPFSATLPSSTPTNTPILPESLLKSLRSLMSAPTQLISQPETKIHPSLFLYISDLFSAIRHHPQLDAMLLTARARKDVEALVRAARVIGGDLTGAEFICVMGKGAEARLEAEENGPGHGAESDDVSSLDVTASQQNGKMCAHDDSAAVISLLLDETLDVSEADIARIVPRVLSHRLRVRDGPEDEILGSLHHGAVANCADWELGAESRDNREKQGTWEKSTVKDILVKILAEV